MKNTMKEEDYKRAGELLNLEPAMVKAVVVVETGGSGAFVAEGMPVILFEGHVFWQRLKLYGINPVDYMIGNEDVLHIEWTRRFYKGGMKEYERLNRAKEIHRKSALESASWGLFQIMGFNHKLCGCDSIEDFVNRMSRDIESQIDLWANYLENTGLAECLRYRKWSLFALRYNGRGYKANKYDKRLIDAYNKFRKEDSE